MVGAVSKLLLEKVCYLWQAIIHCHQNWYSHWNYSFPDNALNDRMEHSIRRHEDVGVE